MWAVINTNNTDTVFYQPFDLLSRNFSFPSHTLYILSYTFVFLSEHFEFVSRDNVLPWGKTIHEA